MRALLAANLKGRPTAGGHFVAVGQWAAGLRHAGYNVTVLDAGDIGDTGPPAPTERYELVLNVMGCLPRDRIDAAQWVFLDVDPGYPQMWRELGLADVFDGHDAFATLGERIGHAGCAIPTCGIEWVTTPPPVALDGWPMAPGGRGFTTVATWRNPYGTVSFNGLTYGSRLHEFRKFLELPRLVEAEFELALDVAPAEATDIRALETNGWRLVEPEAVAGTCAAYQAYIQGSRAEFCVAQNMYVATRSGWLSDRSLCYLASGKPVLAQDTGFGDRYPVGEGLIPFSTLEDAAVGVEEIERNYERHSRAARALSEEFFDAATVVPRMLARLGLRAGVSVG
jgi:hypothetical protein